MYFPLLIFMKQKQESLKYKDTFCILNFTIFFKKICKTHLKKKKKNPKQKRKEYTLCYVIKLKIMTWRFIPIIAMIKGKKLNCYSECGFQLAISKVL